MADHDLENAMQLARDGKTQEAHELFGQIVSAEAHNVPAWLWYAKTAPSAAQRQQVLQDCLRSNPDDKRVREILGLEKGSTTQPRRASAPPQVSSFGLSSQPAPPLVEARPGGKRKGIALIGVSAALLVVFIVVALLLLNRSLPADPGKYRHTGAVEYYLYVPRAYIADRAWPLFVC